MLKKRYVVIMLGIVSVLLVSLFNLALAGDITPSGKPEPKPTDVNVLNFPLDEQGNLRTTTVQTSKIMLVFNQSLTVLQDPFMFTYLTTFNTTVFKYAYIMAKAQGTWQEGAEMSIYAYDNNFGVQTSWKSFELQTGSSYTPSWGSGVSGKYEVHSTSIDLYLRFYNSNVAFDGLLTIVVHLTN